MTTGDELIRFGHSRELPGMAPGDRGTAAEGDDARDRVIVFIDGSNLYHGLKESRWVTYINVGALALRVAGRRRLVRTYYYNARPPGGAEHTQQANEYFAMVEDAPDLVFRPSRLQAVTKHDEYGPYRSYLEKGADTEMSADMIGCAAGDEFDVAIVISSDGDLEPPARKIKESFGKRVECVYFKRSKPSVMERVALMREFRRGFIQEMDRPRKPRQEGTSPARSTTLGPVGPRDGQPRQERS